MASTMQLEFAQAMSDFKTMFPDMDKEVIEAVLRANQGAVDATIDQLLTMSIDNQVFFRCICVRILFLMIFNAQNEKLRNELDTSGGKAVLIAPIDSEPRSLLLSTSPVTAVTATNNTNTGASPKIKKNTCGNSLNASPMRATECAAVRKWNPPILGPLPPGFLRLGPSDVGTYCN